MRIAIRLACRLAFLAAAFSCANAAYAQASIEYAVKANYLYKFAPFVDWPPGTFTSPTDPFFLCIVGRDPFGAVLDQAVKGQLLDTHPIEIRRLRILGPNSGCDIAFIAGSPEQAMGQALDIVRGTPVLTVTDGADNMPRGIIRFVLDRNRVRFEIDDAAAAQNNLVISSKLLSLARSVRPRRQP